MTADTNQPRPWHAMPVADALRRLDTASEGLSAERAAARRQVYGPNLLPRGKRTGTVVIYLRQFKSPLIYLLLGAAVVSLFLAEFLDAAFIFAVLQINALIGTFQEWKAETGAESLRSMVRALAVVRRDGERSRIDAAELVPGDVVFVASGARVPADLRLLSAQELRVNESLLTGESLPVDKDADVTLEPDIVLGERRNVLHAGTEVLSGRAIGVVTETGLKTQVGRIAEVLTMEERAPPPLVLRMARFARVIAVGLLCVIVALAVAELMRGLAVADVFFMAVALAVAAIPEGLPVAMTVALSIATARMARRNVIVRQLPAVEGLGACTMIASDKTGTLTRNELTVRRLYLPKLGDLDVGGGGYIPEGLVTRRGETLEPEDVARVQRLAVSGTLCNEATFREAPGGGFIHFGDTVDVAFLVLARKLGFTREALAAHHPQLASIPFEPHRRFAASFNRDGEAAIAHVKGAAEMVLPMCGNVDREAALADANRMAADGYRVLAVASGPVSIEVARKPSRANLSGLHFLGLVGLIDPLRPEALDAVRRCAGAGVVVAMVTGDHPLTALSIARELGLAATAHDVVTGAALAGLADKPRELDALITGSRVFARVEPAHKHLIVQTLQRHGHFVAVTGDGVNDAPALRAANIGVAMGRDGTDVARAAADLILTDDNFASIVAGVEEGRVAYDNVRKVIYLLISTGAAEVAVFLLSIAAGLPIPLFAVQLLWLNLVTNGIQDVALAFEKGEPGVLDRRPRPPTQGIFDRRMIEQTVLSGLVMGVVAFLFFEWSLGQGWTEFEARNALLLLMVLFENVHCFNCRSERRSVFGVPLRANPFLILGVVAAQGTHVLAMHLPVLQDVLDVAPVSLGRWALVFGLAITLMAVMEGYKLATSRRTA